MIDDPTTNGIQSAVNAGVQIAAPNALVQHRFYSHLIPEGANLEVVDLRELEQKFADHPHRKTGTVSVHDAAGFIDYIEKHGLAASEVWADQARYGLVGVINAHANSDTGLDEGLAGHGDHRVVLELIHSDEWKTWLENDKKWMDQSQFAEHLEDNAVNVVDYPGCDAATMLEIAQSFYASSTADFKRSERLDNGVVALRYEETQNARAGQSGDIEIPRQFVIGIPPFVGADPVEITARFRFRIREGNLALSYALLNADQVKRDTFRAMVDDVNEGISQPVFLGRPA